MLSIHLTTPPFNRIQPVSTFFSPALYLPVHLMNYRYQCCLVCTFNPVYSLFSLFCSLFVYPCPCLLDLLTLDPSYLLYWIPVKLYYSDIFSVVLLIFRVYLSFCTHSNPQPTFCQAYHHLHPQILTYPSLTWSTLPV